MRNYVSSFRFSLATVLTGPQALAFLPALVLGGFWLGGEPVLLTIALAVPLGLAWLRHSAPPPRPEREDEFERKMQETLDLARNCLRRTGCAIIEIDDYDTLLDRHGIAAAEQVGKCVSDRLKTVLREHDVLLPLSKGQFGVVLAPVRQLDSEAGLKLVTRLQAAVEEPISLDAATIYISASVGFCLDSFVRGGTGRELSDAAGIALIEARRNAPSAIRAYSPELQRFGPMPECNATEILTALANGQIRAWFQPQISTDTGNISGFEALARWEHPVRGLIPPGEFLPLLQKLGRTDVLGAKILQDALAALKSWDNAGFHIPQVGVNFSADELRDPKLVDRLIWELDRFDLAPTRLTVEILETVVAYSPEDTIVRNIRRMAELGCHIDLDDFGTGHASISSIRRFAVHRLKIDRSFVKKLDRDVEQQRMVNAIQLMAEHLDLDTIAEGVENAGEHAMLAQLGVGHVQGFGIARPMPATDTIGWIADHMARVQTPPRIGHNAG
ncbi:MULTISPECIES: putative bifunctional diguanylate cyclase/phosphodiesterase [unclassified Roseovarius]|uniref:putative bifunctional diguanylate cyclase/phosphodiesterase n=1 Tax=unclassified Roseovarius TaxID=2614913 RepID=UPI00273F6AF6|nr:GGDEF domain-containing phosphodiesterase [Roseovarius sp. MMSF_3350]